MKKLKINKDTLAGTGGIAICLFALLITLSSNNKVFGFLSVSILTVFGFIGFWILIPAIFILGMYLVIRQKIKKFRFDITIWGIYVIILALLIMTSAWGSEGVILTISSEENVIISMFKKGDVFDEANNVTYTYTSLKFNNCITYFQEIAKLNVQGRVDSTGQALQWYNGLSITDVRLGGGYLGFVLCGALNSLITPVGTTIVFWLAILAGLGLIFNRQLKKLYLYIKNRKVSKSAHDDVYSTESTDYSSNVIYNDNPVSAPSEVQPSAPALEQAPAPSFLEMQSRSFNATHGLQKASFIMDGGEVANKVEDAPKEEVNLFVRQDAPSFVGEPTPMEEELVNNEPTFEPIAPTPVIEEKSEEPAVEDTYAGDPLHKPQPKAVIKPPFKLPPMDLLDYHENLDDLTKNDASCESRTALLNQIFQDMNVGAEVVGHTVGPSVTRYDVKTRANVSVASIKRIEQDISVRLGGVPVRFVPIVLGKDTSGLEMQNEIRTNVGLRESIEKIPEGEKFLTAIPFGQDISGNVLYASLKDFPHMLVAGATGSGKSIFMHATIISLLMKNTPEELKLLLIDPKKVEMNYYKEIPHLLCPNVSDPMKAKVALEKLADEMERRYNLFEENRVRDIKEFNRFAKEKGLTPLPTIAVFIDEYADLSEACKDVRTPVVRIAQKARSAGIHLVIATQRPSVNVIDGVIKANLPTHVALMVSSFFDSNVIIGEGGAELLLGNGDMIVECSAISRANKPRVQGCFIDSPEINRVTDFLRNQGGPQYDPMFLDLEDHSKDGFSEEEIVVDTAALKEASEDQLYTQIKSDLVHKEYCSISFIQRTYGVGFPKAGRMFARLVKDGIVANGGDARGSKVLVHNMEQSEGVTSIDESHVYQDVDANLDENPNPQPSVEDDKDGYQ